MIDTNRSSTYSPKFGAPDLNYLLHSGNSSLIKRGRAIQTVPLSQPAVVSHSRTYSHTSSSSSAFAPVEVRLSPDPYLDDPLSSGITLERERRPSIGKRDAELKKRFPTPPLSFPLVSSNIQEPKAHKGHRQKLRQRSQSLSHHDDSRPILVSTAPPIPSIPPNLLYATGAPLRSAPMGSYEETLILEAPTHVERSRSNASLGGSKSRANSLSRLHRAQTETLRPSTSSGGFSSGLSRSETAPMPSTISTLSPLTRLERMTPRGVNVSNSYGPTSLSSMPSSVGLEPAPIIVERRRGQGSHSRSSSLSSSYRTPLTAPPPMPALPIHLSQASMMPVTPPRRHHGRRGSHSVSSVGSVSTSPFSTTSTPITATPASSLASPPTHQRREHHSRRGGGISSDFLREVERAANQSPSVGGPIERIQTMGRFAMERGLLEFDLNGDMTIHFDQRHLDQRDVTPEEDDHRFSSSSTLVTFDNPYIRRQY
jgi:hypothetical protein